MKEWDNDKHEEALEKRKQKKLDGFKHSIAEIGNTKNLRLALMQEGVIILANLLVDKLQPTAKGDKYVVLFKGDCEELIKTALEKVRSEVNDERIHRLS